MNAAPLKVMCVDDNRDAADSAALLLRCYGYDVRVCYDGPSALAEALRFGPDACLIDFNMPGMDGCEVARRLRAWRRNRPIFLVAVTAHGSDEARERSARAGFDLHLVKPPDWDELTTVLALVERTRGRAEQGERPRNAAVGSRASLRSQRTRRRSPRPGEQAPPA